MPRNKYGVTGISNWLRHLLQPAVKKLPQRQQKNCGHQAGKHVHCIVVPAVHGRKADEDDCDYMQMAEAREVAPREIEGTNGDGHMAAWKGAAMPLEMPVE